MEHNYYANYFCGGSDWCGVGYGIFRVRRDLTRDFAGVFGERKCGAGWGIGGTLPGAQMRGTWGTHLQWLCSLLLASGPPGL